MDPCVISALKPRTDIGLVSAVQKDDENDPETRNNHFRTRIRAELIVVCKEAPWDKDLTTGES